MGRASQEAMEEGRSHPFLSPADESFNLLAEKIFWSVLNNVFLVFCLFVFLSFLTESGSMSWGLEMSCQSRKELVDVSEQFEEVEC